MQAVHVLCDDALRPAHALHLSQSIVCSVGLHGSKLMPSSKASGPVPGPPLLSRHKLQNVWLLMKRVSLVLHYSSKLIMNRLFTSVPWPAVTLMPKDTASSLPYSIHVLHR